MGETKKISGKVAHKHELEKNWLLSSYIPQAGEIVVYDAESTTMDEDYAYIDAPDSRKYAGVFTYPRYKVGNGVNNINDLPFSDQAPWYQFDINGAPEAWASTLTIGSGTYSFTIAGADLLIEPGSLFIRPQGGCIITADTTFQGAVYIDDKEIATKEYIDQKIKELKEGPNLGTYAARYYNDFDIEIPQGNSYILVEIYSGYYCNGYGTSFYETGTNLAGDLNIDFYSLFPGLCGSISIWDSNLNFSIQGNNGNYNDDVYVGTIKVLFSKSGNNCTVSVEKA